LVIWIGCRYGWNHRSTVQIQ